MYEETNQNDLMSKKHKKVCKKFELYCVLGKIKGSIINYYR